MLAGSCDLPRVLCSRLEVETEKLEHTVHPSLLMHIWQIWLSHLLLQTSCSSLRFPKLAFCGTKVNIFANIESSVQFTPSCTSLFFTPIELFLYAFKPNFDVRLGHDCMIYLPDSSMYLRRFKPIHLKPTGEKFSFFITLGAIFIIIINDRGEEDAQVKK